MQQENIVYEDEIDLKELILTLWKKKVFIAVITSSITLLAIVYAFIKEPVYEVKAVLEIGHFKGEGVLEDPQKLIQRITLKYNESNPDEDILQTFSVIKGTSNLLEMKTHAKSNEEGKKKLKVIIDEIKQKHNQEIEQLKNSIITQIEVLNKQKDFLRKKENYYDGVKSVEYYTLTQIDNLKLRLDENNIQPTQLVGDFVVKQSPIKPKKKFIVTVAFVTGFILSIFLVFFIEFVKSIKEHSKK